MNRNGGSESVDCTTGSPLAREACSSDACKLVSETGLVDVIATGLSFDPGGGVEGGTRLHPGLSLPFRKTAADSVPA